MGADQVRARAIELVSALECDLQRMVSTEFGERARELEVLLWDEPEGYKLMCGEPAADLCYLRSEVAEISRRLEAAVQLAAGASRYLRDQAPEAHEAEAWLRRELDGLGKSGPA